MGTPEVPGWTAEDAEVVDRERFQRDGWLRLGHRVAPARVAAVRAALDGTWPHEPDVRWTNAWRRHPEVARLAADPTVLSALAELYGRRPIPFQTLNFRRGSEQHRHADSVHFDSIPAGWMCGVWVALENVGPCQGPVDVVTGSHHLSQLRPESVVGDPDDFDYREYERRVAAEVRGLVAEPFECAAGEVLVWHGDLVHGGSAVTDPASTRWSQVTHYVFEGATCITPMHSDLRRDEYAVRDPLVDISTRRRVRPRVDGAPARVEHLWNGRSRLHPPGGAGPPTRARVRSLLLGAVRDLRARSAGLRHR